MSANEKWLARKADPKYRAYMKEYLRKYMRGYHARRLARLRAERGNKCKVCSATESLHFAHVKPTGLSGWGRGQGDRQRDIVNNPDCYALMCRACHAEMDRKTKTWCNSRNKKG